jgi:osmotically-inducible protein OsmY
MAITRRCFVFALAVGTTPLCGSDEDDSLYDKVHRRLNNDRQLKIQQLKVDVTDGVVTVDGVVRTQKLQEKVVKVAKIKGVKSVVNRVRVVP